MRKTAMTVLAGLALAGGAAAIAGAAQAQPYGSYYPNGRYGYTYAPPQAYDAYGRPVPVTPYYNGYNGYYGNNGYNSYGYSGNSVAGVAGAVLGAVLGQGAGYGYGGNVPYDQYGPDPNGMIGPDGRVIKCKLKRSYDSVYRSYVTRRECRPK